MYYYVNFCVTPAIVEIKQLLYNYNITYLSTFVNNGQYLKLQLSFELDKINKRALDIFTYTAKTLEIRNVEKKSKKCLRVKL